MYFAFAKQVTWMNYQESTLLDGDACGVSGHSVRANTCQLEFNLGTHCLEVHKCGGIFPL